VPLYFPLELRVEVLSVYFIPNLSNFTSRMERQRQEDELRNRSTRKGQDTGQKRVCYYAVIILLFFLKNESHLFCVFIKNNCFFNFHNSVSPHPLSFYSTKMCHVYITLVTAVNWLLSLSGYKPTKKFTSKPGKTM
jgi:hypothetical protein